MMSGSQKEMKERLRQEFTDYAVCNNQTSILQEARSIAYQIQRTNHLHSIPASEDFLKNDQYNYNVFNKAVFEALFNNQNDPFFDGLKETLNLPYFRTIKYDALKRCFIKVKSCDLQNGTTVGTDLFEPKIMIFADVFTKHAEESESRLSQLRLTFRRRREENEAGGNDGYLD
jgi:hypothetical protein